MDGVTILNQFEVVTKTLFGWSACWGGAFVGVIIALFAGIIFGLQENSFLAFVFMFVTVCVIVSPLLGWFAGNRISPEPVEYETHYEVSIDETVNMQEFMDRYEIIETRGSIYTVKEK